MSLESSDTAELPPDAIPPIRSAFDKANRRSRFSELGSLVAVAISFSALALGAYQTNLMQRQARASVWPYMHIRFSYVGDPARADTGFVWQIDNNGVGPALIKTVSLSLDDVPMRNWDEVFTTLKLDGLEQTTISTIQGNVLPANTNRETTIAAIRITHPQQAKIFFDARERFKMSICYCSVYDECWTAKWLQSKVDPAAQCAASDTALFEQ